MDEKNQLNDDIFIDEKGTIWTRPTAWAYAKVCGARDVWHSRSNELSEALNQSITENYKLKQRIEELSSELNRMRRIN